MRVVVVAVVCLFAAACQGDGGAVSVRWRIVDLSTGSKFDPQDIPFSQQDAGLSGECCIVRSSTCPCDKALTLSDQIVIPTVGISLRDPVTGIEVPVPAAETGAKCQDREKTTQFDLPLGTFAIGLSVAAVDGNGQPQPAMTPPPEVRTLERGGVVNLQVIEIGVNQINQLPLP